MPEDTFEEIKPNLFRFTIRKEPAWDDPRRGYSLELIVGFLERDDEGHVRLWYSHHEHYSRKKKNLRWKLDESVRGETTYHLSRDLKDEIKRHACYAWWRHCFTGDIGYEKDRKDPDAERAKELIRMMDEPLNTVR